MLINVVLMVASGIGNSTVYVPTTPVVTNGAASSAQRLTDDPYSSDYPCSGDTPPQPSLTDGQGGGMGSEGGNPFADSPFQS